MKSMVTLEAEMVRIGILKTLGAATSFVASLDLLCERHVTGKISMFEHVCWLEEHGLVEFNQTENTDSVRITRMGHDVARGRTLIAGVRRPEP